MHGQADMVEALLNACSSSSGGGGCEPPQPPQRLLLLPGVSRRTLTEAVNAAGQSPLHLAAAGNHVAAIRALAARGAELDAWGGPEGTPLHTAAAAGHLAAVRALLEAGADPDAAGSSATTGAGGLILSGTGKRTVVQRCDFLLCECFAGASGWIVCVVHLWWSM
jgi:hypothetical protein